MKVNVRGRQCGCTTDLIITSDVTGAIIVCPNSMWARNVEDLAKKMNRDVIAIPYNILAEKTMGRHGVPLLFDGFEKIVEQIILDKFGNNVIGCMVQGEQRVPLKFPMKKEVKDEDTKSSS